jgi:hypothetical protein
MILATAMVGNAAARFVITAKNIDREDLRPGTGSPIDIAFAGLLVLMACALFLLTHALETNVRTDFRNRFAVFIRDEINAFFLLCSSRAYNSESHSFDWPWPFGLESNQQ